MLDSEIRSMMQRSGIKRRTNERRRGQRRRACRWLMHELAQGISALISPSRALVKCAWPEPISGTDRILMELRHSPFRKFRQIQIMFAASSFS